jgi:3-phenylpropionate/cinnamic acid dioxygenase small subunit
VDVALLHDVSDLLYREGAYLDAQRWDEWLALYTEDCEFWMPAWDGDHELTTDPKSQMSLIYYDSRVGLEERIVRIRSGLSAASTPLPRTSHMVTNVRLGERAGNELVLDAQWQTSAFRNQESQTFYGRYEYKLRAVNGTWRIARKKIILLNDVITTALDIYHI